MKHMVIISKRHSCAAAKVAEFAQNNTNHSARRQFGVSDNLVRDWKKKKVELAELPNMSRVQRVGTMLHWPELE